ncbi:MAG: hypothetical protein ACFHVJ_17635 [Aestuariibacter sp.]
MKTVKNIENAGRQAWLAGLGVVLVGKEYATKKFDEVFEGTNSLINEMLSKGTVVESDLKLLLEGKKVDNAKVAELREKLGLNKESKEDRLTRLSAKVEALTDVVHKLVEQQKAEVKAAPAKPAAKKAPARKPSATASKAAASKSTSASTSKATSETKAATGKTTTRRSPAKKPATKPATDSE